ncbi:MAG TPA: DUF2795 domain-containing protein [Anaerolineae bacterium]|nr:DUF2795 domain-containing protein [Anaerolineae bacterium]
MLDEKIKKELMEHIRSDVGYPASKQQILAACNNMTMHSPEAKSAAEKLPEQTFQNAGEALKALAL